VDRQEVEALLETRRELGPTYDEALVDAFADRIDAAVAARSAERSAGLTARERIADEAGKRQWVLGIVSLGTGIPITALAGTFADLPGIAVAWLGIVGVNAAHASAVNGRRDR
jgi:hypothetical protein